MKILAVSAHTDDAELGIGATLAKHIESGHEVQSIALSYCKNEALIKEFQLANAELGITDLNVYPFHNRTFDSVRQEILDVLIKVRDKFNPDIVYIPSPQIHQDHFVTFSECLRAFKTQNIYCYELPWNDMNSQITGTSQITEQQLEKKLKAISRYESQKDKTYFNPVFTKSLAIVRGIQARCEFAEAVEIIRHRL